VAQVDLLLARPRDRGHELGEAAESCSAADEVAVVGLRLELPDDLRVVFAPTSAMISASSRRSHVSSSTSPSKSVACTSACSASRVFDMFSRSRLKKPRRRTLSSSVPAGAGLGSGVPVMKRSRHSRGIAARHDTAVPLAFRPADAATAPAADLIEAMVVEVSASLRAHRRPRGAVRSLGDG
jgi:hypothetical protein